jgi:hypothetical protein
LPYIKQYPESLQLFDDWEGLTLHTLLRDEFSPIEVALTMIEKHPAALQHKYGFDYLPLLIECQQLLLVLALT